MKIHLVPSLIALPVCVATAFSDAKPAETQKADRFDRTEKPTLVQQSLAFERHYQTDDNASSDSKSHNPFNALLGGALSLSPLAFAALSRKKE